jgi:hypothetical protein
MISIIIPHFLRFHLEELLRYQVRDDSKQVITSYCEGFTAWADKYTEMAEYSYGYCGLIEMGVGEECWEKVGQIMQFMSGDFMEMELLDTPFASYNGNVIGTIRQPLHDHFQRTSKDQGCRQTLRDKSPIYFWTLQECPSS